MWHYVYPIVMRHYVLPGGVLLKLGMEMMTAPPPPPSRPEDGVIGAGAIRNPVTPQVPQLVQSYQTWNVSGLLLHPLFCSGGSHGDSDDGVLQKTMIMVMVVVMW